MGGGGIGPAHGGSLQSALPAVVGDVSARARGTRPDGVAATRPGPRQGCADRDRARGNGPPQRPWPAGPRRCRTEAGPPPVRAARRCWPRPGRRRSPPWGPPRPVPAGGGPGSDRGRSSWPASSRLDPHRPSTLWRGGPDRASSPAARGADPGMGTGFSDLMSGSRGDGRSPRVRAPAAAWSASRGAVRVPARANGTTSLLALPMLCGSSGVNSPRIYPLAMRVSRIGLISALSTSPSGGLSSRRSASVGSDCWRILSCRGGKLFHGWC